jgi:hypothetical protein
VEPTTGPKSFPSWKSALLAAHIPLPLVEREVFDSRGLISLGERRTCGVEVRAWATASAFGAVEKNAQNDPHGFSPVRELRRPHFLVRFCLPGCNRRPGNNGLPKTA